MILDFRGLPQDRQLVIKVPHFGVSKWSAHMSKREKESEKRVDQNIR